MTDHHLVGLLLCPVCKGPLQMRHDELMRPTELVCPADRLGFPLRDGVPVMLENEARALTAEEAARR
ncbi:MAG: Trm112 family protein [Betaproteobacteria bacterium]|nr:Trm112 family protein [Betaproteobacteria bacterium]MCC6249665.1 Trm112 family protein [Rubrivivax sp.]MCL4699926.1 Trm112 family protein [Burkholderiaceae bacterium]